MKKTISILLLVALILNLFSISAAASSTPVPVSVPVIVSKNGEDISGTLHALYADGDLYVIAEDLASLTRYRCTASGNQKYTFSLGQKYVVVDLSAQTLHVNGVQQPFTRSIESEGYVYLPMSTMLPWMNVSVTPVDPTDGDSEGEKLLIASDKLSYWEVIDRFQVMDHYFAYAEEMGGDSLANKIGLSSIYLFDSLLNLGDTWKKFATVSGEAGDSTLYEYEIYETCFREFAVPKEDANEVVALSKEGSELYSHVTTLTKYLADEDDTAAAETNKLLKKFGSAWKSFNTILACIEILNVDTLSYADALEYIYLRRSANSTEGEKIAAMQAVAMCRSNEGAILETTVQLLKEYTLKSADDLIDEWDLIGSTVGECLTVVDIALTAIWPINEAYNEAAKLPAYSAIQQHAVDAFFDARVSVSTGAASKKQIDLSRMTAVIYLQAARKCFQAKDEMLSVWGADGLLEYQLNGINEMLMDFRLCGPAAAHDAIDDKSGETNEIRLLLQQLCENTETGGNTQVPGGDSSFDYQLALSAYSQMLRNGVVLPMDNGDTVSASHYQLLDMNSDGIPEIIVYAVEDYIPTFEIYTYRGGSIHRIADSLNTCDLSKWYNASHNLEIFDGIDVYAVANMSTVSYSESSSALLRYNGGNTCYTSSNYGSPSSSEILISDSKVVGGIRIGSAEDCLTGTSTPPPEVKPENGSPDGWSEWTSTPILATNTLEVETMEVYDHTEYRMGHYCTGNVPGAAYRTFHSNTSANEIFNQNCQLHELGCFTSLASFSRRNDGAPGYVGSLCSNTCFTWYIMEEIDVYTTYYRSRAIGSNTGSGQASTDTLADGEYYGDLTEWDSSTMTLELKEHLGWNDDPPMPLYQYTGLFYTLNVENAQVWLEGGWTESSNALRCTDIDHALSHGAWGGTATVSSHLNVVQVFFTVINGSVSEIYILYTP